MRKPKKPTRTQRAALKYATSPDERGTMWTDGCDEMAFMAGAKYKTQVIIRALRACNIYSEHIGIEEAIRVIRSIEGKK